eukprot:8621966-Pyramimonas_sp.AAC.1
MEMLLFAPAPKLHWTRHMAYRARFSSTRRGATFIDKDSVKHMKNIAGKSGAGTKMHEVPNTLVDAYRWGVTLE